MLAARRALAVVVSARVSQRGGRWKSSNEAGPDDDDGWRPAARPERRRAAAREHVRAEAVAAVTAVVVAIAEQLGAECVARVAAAAAAAARRRRLRDVRNVPSDDNVAHHEWVRVRAQRMRQWRPRVSFKLMKKSNEDLIALYIRRERGTRASRNDL